MGIFHKLFGGNKNNSGSDSKSELRKEYNVMKNIVLETSKKYDDNELYELVESGIYKDLSDDDDAKYRMTISYELETEQDQMQYPLEDILDEYLLHVSDFLETENEDKSQITKIELGGELKDIRKSKEIIGKSAFNRDYIDNGEVRVKLVIE